MLKEILNEGKKTKGALLGVIILFVMLMGLVVNKIIYSNKYDNKIKISKAEVTKYASKNEAETGENTIKGYDTITYKINYMLETEDKKEISDRTAIVEATLSNDDIKYASWNNVEEENITSEIINSGKTLRLTITNVTTNKQYSLNAKLNIVGAPDGFSVSPEIKVEEKTTPTDEIVKPTTQVVKTKSISGKVVNKQTGNVENNVELQICKIDAGTCDDKKTTYTKEDGSYSFSDLQNGKYQIKIVDEVNYALVKEIEEVTIIDESITLNIEIANQTKFRASIKKYVRKVIVTENGQEKAYNYGKIDKALVAVKNIKNADIKIIYEFEIKNETEKEGYVKVIKENIPEGLEYDSNYEENKGWEEIDGVLYNKTLANETIKANETKIVTIALKTKDTTAAKNYLNKVSITGENYYTVKYVVNNEVVKELSVIDSDKIDDYKYEKEGYEFIGWYTDKEYKNKYDFNSVVEDDLVLYGKAEAKEPEKTCSVTYIDKGHEIEGSGIVECGQTITPDDICEKGDNCDKPDYEFECWRDADDPTVCLTQDTSVTKEITLVTSYIKLPTPEISHVPTEWTKENVTVSMNFPTNAKKIRSISKKTTDETGLITYSEEEITTEEDFILTNDKYDIRYQIVSEKEYTDEAKEFEPYTLLDEWNSYTQSFIQEKNAIVVGKVVVKNTNESSENLEHEIINIDKKAPNMNNNNTPQETSILLTGTVVDNQSLPNKVEIYYIEGSNVDIVEFLNDDSKKDLINVLTYEFENKTLSTQNYSTTLNNLTQDTTYTVGIVAYDVAGNKTDMDAKDITTSESIIVAQIIGRNGALYETEDEYEPFPSLEAARQSCGDTIDVCTVQMVLNTNESVEIGSNQNITLDLNGKIVSGVIGAYTIRNNGKFTVIDNAEETGRIENTNKEGIALDNINVGILTLGVDETPQNVSNTRPNIVGTKNGVQNSSTSTFNFYDGRIKGNVAINGEVYATPYLYNANVAVAETQVATLSVLAEAEARINKSRYYINIADAVNETENGYYEYQKSGTSIMSLIQWGYYDYNHFNYNEEDGTLNSSIKYDGEYSHSFIELDLSCYTKEQLLTVNAEMTTPLHLINKGYIYISESVDFPESIYNSETYMTEYDFSSYMMLMNGVSGNAESTDYTLLLEPGKEYYLHFFYHAKATDPIDINDYVKDESEYEDTDQYYEDLQNYYDAVNNYYELYYDTSATFTINGISLKEGANEPEEELREAIPVLNQEIDTVEMLKDIALSKTLKIEDTRDVILDLSGQKLTTSSIGYVIENNGSLKIIDSAYESDNPSSYGNITNANGDVIYNAFDANLVIDDAIINVNSEGKSGVINNGTLALNKNAIINVNGVDNNGVLNDSNAQLNAKNSTINLTKSSFGIKNYSEEPITIDNLTIEGPGTGIYIASSTNSSINNVNINANYGITNTSNSTMNITGGEITSEYDSITNSGNLTISGINIYSNSGSALKNSNGIATVKNAVKMTSKNIGIYNQSSSVLYVDDVEIETSNKGLYNYNAEAIINNAKINSQELAVANTGTMTINDGEISGVRRGISNSSNSILTINQGTIFATAGSGIATGDATIQNFGTLTIKDGTISSNQLDAIYSNGTVNIIGGEITTSGYAINNSSSATLNIGQKDGMVSTENPKIESSKKIGINNEGKINFYDGVIIGKKNSGITGTVNDSEDGYDLLIKDENATLENITLAIPTIDVFGEVARIDDTIYPSIKSAINAVPDNEEKTITLLKNIRTIVTNNVSENKNIILDTNDVSVTSHNTLLENSGILSINGTGTLNYEVGTLIENIGTLTVNDGTILGSKAINNNSTGNLTINNGTISGAIAIYNDGIAVMNNGTVKSNTNTGIYNNSTGNVTVKAGEITSTTKNGIGIANIGTLTLGIKGDTKEDGNLNVSITSPSVDGIKYGVNNSGVFNFYDGIVKGITAIYGTNPGEIEEGYLIVGGKEDSKETKYLAKTPIAQILDASGNVTENQCGSVLDEDNACYSIQDAIAATQTNETVQMLSGITLNTPEIEVLEDKNILLDLNGYIVSNINITNEGNLILKDSSTSKSGVLSGTIKNGGTASINGGTVSSINNISSGDVTVNDGTITSINNESTGNVIVNGGTVSSIKNISSGDVTVNDGAIKSISNKRTGDITINGGVISLGRVGISNESSGTITVNGGTIDGETGIYNESSGTLIIKGGKISNSSYGLEYAIENKGNVIIEDGTITSRYAIGNLSTSGVITINGGTIQTLYILNKYGTMTINDVILNAKYIENSGVLKIGGGEITSSDTIRLIKNLGGDLTIDGGTITSPVLDDYAIQNTSGKIAINGGKIISSGGGIINDSTGTINITGGEIISTSIAINNASNGAINVGQEDGVVSSETPRIKSSTVGVSNMYGTFNFYDGVIIGEKNSGITGTVNDSEDGYDLLIKDEEETLENITLAIPTIDVFGEVARMDDTIYPSIVSAINAVPDNEEKTITLLKDIRTIVTNNVSENKNIILNTNGINVVSYNTLLENKGILNINGTGLLNASGTLIENFKTLTINDGTLSGAIAIYNDGITVMNNGTVKSISDNSTAINNNSIVTITGGTIESTGLLTNGITNNSGTVNIGVQDGVVNTENPTITGTNYGIYNSNVGNINLHDGIITGPTGKSTYGNISVLEENYKLKVIQNVDETESTTLELMGVDERLVVLGGVNYPDLQSAINAAPDGIESVITLYAKITLTDNVVVPENKTIKLNLNGFSIDYAGYTISGSFTVEGDTNQTSLTAAIMNIFTGNTEDGMNVIAYEMNDGSNLSILNTYELQVYNDNKYEKVNVENEINNVGRYSITNKTSDTKMTTINGKLFLNNLSEGNYKIVDNNGKELIFTISEDGTLSGNIKENYTQNLNRIMSTAQAELIVSLQTGQKVIRYGILVGIISTMLGLLILLRRQIIFKNSLKEI